MVTQVDLPFATAVAADPAAPRETFVEWAGPYNRSDDGALVHRTLGTTADDLEALEALHAIIAEHSLGELFWYCFGGEIDEARSEWIDGLPDGFERFTHHFWGNFATYSFCFRVWTNDPAVAKRLSVALTENARRAEASAERGAA